MAELGEMLRDARLAKGVSLQEAERETKIRAKYLAALEDDDPSLLPGPVYARGFLKNYAYFLDLNPKTVIDLYETQNTSTRSKIRAARGESIDSKRDSNNVEDINIQPLSQQPLDTRVRYGSSYIAVSLLAVPLIILFYFVYSFWGSSRNVNLAVQTPGLPTLTPLSLASLPTQLLTASSTGDFNTPTVAVVLPPNEALTNTPIVEKPTNVPAGEVTVKIVTTRDAWMRVLVDGVQQFNGTLAKDSTRTWTGKTKVRIRTGRADAVQLTVNGEDKGLMNIGDSLIVEKEWDRSGNEVIIK